MSPPAGSAARLFADPALGEDIVVPFQVARLGVRGRMARLGPMVTEILSAHHYPEPVSRLLAEAVALTAMLGTALKFDGRFILQTKTDGPVDMLVADLRAPGSMRGYAHFDAARVEEMRRRGTAGPEALLGRGHLAMTIDPGAGMERYQGVVPLEESDLAEAANLYFRQSEQIPTRTCLAAGVIVEPGAGGRSWRAGGLLVQHLPESLPGAEADTGRALHLPGESEQDDGWRKAEALVATIQDHELLDPALSPLRLLYQLFHEDGVTAAPARPLERHCSCSREAVATMLRQFSPEELADMVEQGRISVTCEFCSSQYDFEPSEFDLD